MDPQSIVEPSSAMHADEEDVGGSAGRSATTMVSAADAHVPKPARPGTLSARDDVRRTLAEMAGSDLDAALQLLAERAQYITAASGAAIALRRGEHNDMLCRASAGSNAPELGALLSMEYGLSGESVRTRQTLRCDDAERDPRVNREGCRRLGIASVVVMPIVSDQQVLGVFELFSGKPRAFEERDISALQRLSEIVETAVKHAVAAQSAVATEQPAPVETPVEEVVAPVETVATPDAITGPSLAVAAPVDVLPSNHLPPAEPLPAIKTGARASEPKTELEKPEPSPKKPLFWSAAQTASGGVASREIDQVVVPPVLRSLRKCQACGFPVSQGRTLCVECEEKRWRGQPLSASSKGPAGAEEPPPAAAIAGATPTLFPVPTKEAAGMLPIPVTPASVVNPEAQQQTTIRPNVPDAPASGNSTLFLGSATSSESWLGTNKYIVGALLIVALIIAAIVWLR